MIEIDHFDGNPVFQKRAVDIFFPADAQHDFPVAMQISKKYDIIFMVTKFGYVHLYDLETGICLFMNRVSSETIFVTSEIESNGGILGVNRKGLALSISIDENKLVSYVMSQLNNIELAYRMAIRNSLPGADGLVLERFNQCCNQGNFSEAAKIAANSPKVIRMHHLLMNDISCFDSFF